MKSATVLLRHAHPTFFVNGELSSQAFCPTAKDEGKLSVYDGDQISARDSYKHYTQVLKCQANSTWGVTAEEVKAVELPCGSDPLPDFPSHSNIDFADRNQNTCRKLAKKLRDSAFTRGCLYSPPAKIIDSN